MSGARLAVRRTIDATPERLFSAWTDPSQLTAWWGPEGVVCTGADVDPRPGGDYRIGNRLPGGAEIWIVGTFETIDRPRLLVYSWLVEGQPGDPERVTVRFDARDGVTDVVVTHEQIPSDAVRDQHAHGWQGCLDGLARFMTAAAQP